MDNNLAPICLSVVGQNEKYNNSLTLTPKLPQMMIRVLIRMIPDLLPRHLPKKWMYETEVRRGIV